MPRVQPTPAAIDYEVAPQSNLLQYVDHGGYKTELGSEVEVSIIARTRRLTRAEPSMYAYLESWRSKL